jgi:hypothetical protein
MNTSAVGLRERLGFEQVTFVQSDIFDYIKQEKRSFDICLLLSVVHQWLKGYAQTGIGGRSLDAIEALLTDLVMCVERVIYFEGPEKSEIDTGAALDVPYWLYERKLIDRITPIAVSVAANGSLRTMYRLER